MVNVKRFFIACLVVFTLCVVGQPAFSLEKININTASVEQLTQLNGVGPATAQKIVEYRQEKKFDSIDELTNVKGVGEKTLDKFRDQLTVGDK
ncbi:MAG: ComEA family DNA-binding protein [Desulfuromonadales bacterium]|nr:ComEA family DNA-binding protein [Desulfuromonadales bacterium]